MDIRKRIAKNVKARRKELRRSQTQCAENAGMSPAQWNHVECSRRTPSVENLERIAIALHCQVSDLVGDNPTGIMKRVLCPCCGGDGIVPISKARAYERFELESLAGIAKWLQERKGAGSEA